MGQTKRRRKSDQHGIWIALVLLSAALIIVYNDQSEQNVAVRAKPRETASVSPYMSADNEKVNLHMRKTQLNMEANRLRVEKEFSELPSLQNGNSAGSGVDYRIPGAEGPQEDYFSDRMEHLDSRSKLDSVQKSLDSQTQSELLHRQYEAQAQVRQQQEFVEQFIENARKNGYHVRVDSNLNVIDVKPINRRPNSEGAYPGAR